MNKKLIQKLVKDYNDYRNDEMIYIIIECDNINYNCYDRVTYGNKGIAFIDEDNKAIMLPYENIVGVKVKVI